GLVAFAKCREDRIIAVKNHLVIELLINPDLHGSFDVAEVDNHAAFVEMVTFHRNQGPAIVAVEEATLAVVIKQPVAVAEINFASNAVHRSSMFRKRRSS